jgi:hypothetical protein
MPDGEGGGAVGRAARIASKVAAFIGAVAVDGPGSGDSGDVAVGRLRGDKASGAGDAVGDKGDESGAKSVSRAVRHTRRITTSPTASPKFMRMRVRRLTFRPQKLALATYRDYTTPGV